jgi:hypothetical protein
MVTLTEGRPFLDGYPQGAPQVKGKYLDILKIGEYMSSGTDGGKQFIPRFSDSSLYVTTFDQKSNGREWIGAFNKSDKIETDRHGNWRFAMLIPKLPDYQEIIAPLMIAEALREVFLSYERRMRDIDSRLEELSFDSVPGQSPTKTRRSDRPSPRALGDKATKIRNLFLGLTTDIAIFCRNISIANTISNFWGRYPSVDSGVGNFRISRDKTKNDLGLLMARVQAREKALRELVLIISDALSDVRESQTQKNLNRLTIILVVLTVVLVFIGIATLVKPG